MWVVQLAGREVDLSAAQKVDWKIDLWVVWSYDLKAD